MFITYLRTSVFTSRKNITLCRENGHSINVDGTIQIEKIKDISKCCKQFIVIDKDNLDDKFINKIEDHTKNVKGKLIITNPCFELLLISLFKNVKNVKTNNLQNELNEFLNIDKKISKLDLVEKTLKKVFEQKNKEETLKLFENNLKILKESNKSNFLELYVFLKGE